MWAAEAAHGQTGSGGLKLSPDGLHFPSEGGSGPAAESEGASGFEERDSGLGK